MKWLFALLLIFFLPRTNVSACDCVSNPVNLETIKSAELIFMGEVVAISGCDGTAKATFSVKELFRGKTFANETVEFDCSSSCQMSFLPGETWLIYATYKKYGESEVNFCSLSRKKFSNESDDYYTATHQMNFTEEQEWLKKNLGLQQLNEKEPEAEQHHENIRPEGYQMLWYLGGGLLAVIAFYFIGRKFLK
jgi:hypothetical protein